MTYGELYASVKTWTARHVAQDLMLMYGHNTEASEYDIKVVVEWEEKGVANPNLGFEKVKA